LNQLVLLLGYLKGEIYQFTRLRVYVRVSTKYSGGFNCTKEETYYMDVHS